MGILINLSQLIGFHRHSVCLCLSVCVCLSVGRCSLVVGEFIHRPYLMLSPPQLYWNLTEKIKQCFWDRLSMQLLIVYYTTVCFYKQRFPSYQTTYTDVSYYLGTAILGWMANRYKINQWQVLTEILLYCIFSFSFSDLRTSSMFSSW